MNGKAATRKEDKSINGISISDKEFKVSHFAGNTSLLLEGDKIKSCKTLFTTLCHIIGHR